MRQSDQDSAIGERWKVELARAAIPGHVGRHEVATPVPVDDEWHERARRAVHLECEGRVGAAERVHAIADIGEGWAIGVALEKGPAGIGVSSIELRPMAEDATVGARLLRKMGFSRVADEAEKMLNNFMVSERLLGAGWREPVKHPGRAGRQPGEYLAWACRYVAALEASPRAPIKHIVETMLAEGDYVTSSMVAAYVNRARDDELLTRPAKGKAGGELTDKARALLALLEEG